MQTRLGHEPVHDEGGARHVAGVFENPEEEIEDEDLRQKDDHATDTGDDAVGEQSAQVALGRHMIADPFGEGIRAVLDPIHRHLGEGEDAEKHQRHHPEEGDPAPDAVGEPAIELVGKRDGVMAVAAVMRGGADLADPIVTGVHGGGERIDAGGEQALLRGLGRRDDRCVVMRHFIERGLVQGEEQERFTARHFLRAGQLFGQGHDFAFEHDGHLRADGGRAAARASATPPGAARSAPRPWSRPSE